MRIQDRPSLKDLGKNSKSRAPVKPGLGSFFETELTQRSDEMAMYGEDIETLRKEVENIGSRLAQEPTLANFKQFRDLLSKVAKRVSAEAYRLEKFGGTPQNPRYFEIITVINSEADNLYRLIVSENRDNMAITAKVIGIKGLVVDLVT